jgi:cytochrome c553
VQVGAHMMRTNDSRFPDPHPIDPMVVWDPSGLGDSYNGRKLESGHFRSDFADIMHRRINSFWDVGASERGSRHPFRDNAPEFLRIKTTDHAWDSSVSQVTWMWQGMVYDPALQFSAGGNKTEYFFEESTDYQGIAGGFEKRLGRGVTRSQDLAIHRELMRAYLWAHEQFGYDTRYESGHLNGDPVSGRYFCGRGTPDYRGLPETYGGDHGIPEGHQRLVNDLRANLIRVMTLAVHGSFRELGVSRADASCIGSQIDVWAALRDYEGAAYATLEPYVNDLVRGLGEEGATIDKFRDAFSEEEVHRLRLEARHEHPARNEPMPLSFPDGADAPLEPGPISLAFAQKCAGCHGTEGEGRMDGIEPVFYPPISGFPDRELFRDIVRAGSNRTAVSMPAFDASRLSDEELDLVFERLSR